MCSGFWPQCSSFICQSCSFAECTSFSTFLSGPQFDLPNCIFFVSFLGHSVSLNAPSSFIIRSSGFECSLSS